MRALANSVCIHFAVKIFTVYRAGFVNVILHFELVFYFLYFLQPLERRCSLTRGVRDQFV